MFFSVNYLLVCVYYLCFVDGNKYEFVATCLCPGYEIFIKCTLAGSGVIQWRGTYFDLCIDGPITLRRSNSSEGIITRICDADRLTDARVISAMNHSFSSKLTVNVSEGMHRKTIECVHHNGSDEYIIGTTQILLYGIL